MTQEAQNHVNVIIPFRCLNVCHYYRNIRIHADGLFAADSHQIYHYMTSVCFNDHASRYHKLCRDPILILIYKSIWCNLLCPSNTIIVIDGHNILIPIEHEVTIWMDIFVLPRCNWIMDYLIGELMYCFTLQFEHSSLCVFNQHTLTPSGLLAPKEHIF